MTEQRPSLPDGYRLLAFDEIDSTNAEAARRADAGEEGPVWLWAGRQTRGRGRYSRPWASEPGNLYATLVTAAPGPRPADLSFAMALALHDAAAACLPEREAGGLSLKWPNDLLLDGAKVSGLLLEAVGRREGDGAPVLAIGFGLNIAHKPDIADYAVTSLADHGATVAPARALEHLAAKAAWWIGCWDEGRGFAAIRDAWLARARGLGGQIAVTSGSERMTGLFEDLAEDGALILRLPDGTARRIFAGDVFLPGGNRGAA